jgi:Leucine-rich repeat (LRR) protein
VNDLLFANDSSHLISVSSDCTLRVASVPKIATCELHLQGFRSKLSAALVCRAAVIVAGALSLDSIEFSTGREIFSVAMKSPCCCAAALPSGDRLVAVGHSDGSVSVRLTDTGAALNLIQCGTAPVLNCMSISSLLLLHDGAGSIVFRSLSDVALACVNHPLRSTTMPAARRCLQQCVADTAGTSWSAHQKSGSRATLVAVSCVAAADELSIDWSEAVSGNSLMSSLFVCRWFSTEASLPSLDSLPDLLIDDTSFPLSAPITNGVITVKDIKEFAKQWRIIIPKDLRTLTEILDFVNERIRDSRAESLLLPHFDWPLRIPNAAAAAADKSVDVSNTRLGLIPAELLKLQGLTLLNASCCSLKFVPSSIRHALRLLHFSACNNQIQNIPEEFRFCSALQTLHMSCNTLQFLPPGISQLTCLTQLWLSSNNLRSLREEVASLLSLTDLRISSNSFRDWPDVLGQLTRLVHLDVSRCTFRQLPATAVRGNLGLQRLTSLKHLDLSLCALVAPPPAGFLPPSLTSLYLAANPFQVSRNPTSLSHSVHISFAGAVCRCSCLRCSCRSCACWTPGAAVPFPLKWLLSLSCKHWAVHQLLMLHGVSQSSMPLKLWRPRHWRVLRTRPLAMTLLSLMLPL